MAIALSVLTILAAVIPMILKIMATAKEHRDALRDRSLSELHAGTDRVRPVSETNPPV